MQKLTMTEKMLQEMFTENTGANFLDSGGAYGRNWERNQGRTFLDEPDVKLSFDPYFEFSVNTYNFLRNRLRYEAGLTEGFHNFMDKHDWSGEDSDWVKLIGGKDHFRVNTYNHESLLDTILLTTTFQFEKSPKIGIEDTYIILRVHGGCDARGGYTAPKVFSLVDEDMRISDDCTGYVSCTACSAHWNADDGYNFRPDHETEKGDLNDIEVLTDEDEQGICPECEIGLLVGHV